MYQAINHSSKKTNFAVASSGGLTIAPIIVNPHLPQVRQWVAICQRYLSPGLEHSSTNFIIYKIVVDLQHEIVPSGGKLIKKLLHNSTNLFLCLTGGR